MDANMEQASCSAPQRLVITEMVLENFKSYAGEQRVGPLHKARVEENTRCIEKDGTRAS